MVWQRSFDLKEILPVTQDAAATVTGTGVDLQPYINPGGREMKVSLSSLDTGLDADETLDVTIEEGDTLGGSYTAISGAAFTQHAQADGAKFETIHFKTLKRFVRAVATIAGTTPEFSFAAMLLTERRVS